MGHGELTGVSRVSWLNFDEEGCRIASKLIKEFYKHIFYNMLLWFLCIVYSMQKNDHIREMTSQKYGYRTDTPTYRAGICKRLWSPGIDSEESISPAYVAWRASTTNKVSYRPARLRIDTWSP
jgi:hypothetical protein